jgi:hypothetical protein
MHANALSVQYGHKHTKTFERAKTRAREELDALHAEG